MPYIGLQTNLKISKEQALKVKADFGKSIELIPGKNEQWLMVTLSDEETMFFKGSDAPAAFVEVKLFGASTAANYQRLTAAITDTVSKELSVPADRIYVVYREIDQWAWNGGHF